MSNLNWCRFRIPTINRVPVTQVRNYKLMSLLLRSYSSLLTYDLGNHYLSKNYLSSMSWIRYFSGGHDKFLISRLTSSMSSLSDWRTGSLRRFIVRVILALPKTGAYYMTGVVFMQTSLSEKVLRKKYFSTCVIPAPATK